MKTKMMICPGCGAEMDIDFAGRQALCSYCGSKVILGDEVIKKHFEDEAKLKEAEIRLKELEYNHERELLEEHNRQVWKKAFWISVAAYIAILAAVYTNRGTESPFVIIFLFGGIALIAMNASQKKNFSKSIQSERSSKDWLTTLLLCIFLGGLGIHRFYVGRIGWGIVYIFTLGLFGIGWLVDIVLIVCGLFKDGDGYYVQL